MKKITVIGLLLIAVGLLSFIGCSKDSGTEYGKDDLIGKWQAVKEDLDLETDKFTWVYEKSDFLFGVFECPNSRFDPGIQVQFTQDILDMHFYCTW